MSGFRGTVGQADGEHGRRAVDGVAAHAAVAMPRQVGEALGHVGALPQDRHPVHGLRVVGDFRRQVLVRGLDDATDPRVVSQSPQARAAGRSQHTSQHLGPPGVPSPPGGHVARPSLVGQHRGIGQHPGHLIGVEGPADPQVASCSQEVSGRLVPGVVEGESPVRV